MRKINQDDPSKTEWIEVDAYPITYKYEDDESGKEYGSYIGVCKGTWHDAIEDSYIDHKCYYFMDNDEFEKTKVGDIIGEVILTSISRESEMSQTIIYNPKEFTENGQKLQGR